MDNESAGETGTTLTFVYAEITCACGKQKIQTHAASGFYSVVTCKLSLLIVFG